MNITNIHHKYMNIAINEAVIANKKGEIPVGSVLLSNNLKIMAKSHNQVIRKCDPTAHSEILTIKIASKKHSNYRLSKSTLYVTLEPCLMCIGAIINSRIQSLIFGISNKIIYKNFKYNLSYNYYFNYKINIIKGVYAKKCEKLIKTFFINKRLKKKQHTQTK